MLVNMCFIQVVEKLINCMCNGKGFHVPELTCTK